MTIGGQGLARLQETLGARYPESRGKVFGPLGSSSVEVYEDDPAAAEGGLPAYRSDIEWAAGRLVYWGKCRCPYEWVDDSHRQPDHSFGLLGGQDLSHVAKVFSVNPMVGRRGMFVAPVLTFDPDGVPVLWPRSVLRDMAVVCLPLRGVVDKGGDTAGRCASCG